MTDYTPRRRVLPTPATLALLGAGRTVSELAEALSVTDPAASHYLAGRRRLPDHFADTLRGLVGDEHTRAVMALIPAHVDRRLRQTA